MIDITADFGWPVSVGHRFIDSESEQNGVERFLVSIPREHEPPRRHFPLQEASGLFLEFAKLDLNEESFCRFADRYGMLGRGDPLVHPDQPGPSMNGEAFQTWAFAVSQMGEAVSVWQMWKANDSAGLRKRFVWDRSEPQRIEVRYLPVNPVVPRIWDSARYRRIGVVADSILNEEWFRAVEEGDVLAPARRYLNLALSQWVAPSGSIVVRDQPGAATPQVRIAPNHLLGAMWLQFAKAVEQNKQYRQCGQCERWLEVAPTAARKNRLFCSNACKVKSYRQRRAEGGSPGGSETETDG